jgi:hypothetical protein
MSDRRAAERIQIVAAVECSSGGQREIATAYDISTDGCLLQASLGLLADGDCVRLRFGHGQTAEGHVAWTRNRNAGVQFAVPLSRAAVATIVRRSAQWSCEPEVVQSGRMPAGVVLAPAAQLYRLHYAFCVVVMAGCAATLLLHR